MMDNKVQNRKEITLQDLINQVRDELLTSPTDVQVDKDYPLFLVDQVELEVVVDFSYDAKAGIKISVPQILEGSVEGGQGKVSGHTMKLTLKPILTYEERRREFQKYPKLWERIVDIQRRALTKTSNDDNVGGPNT
jgi:hypothetical protein